MAQAHLPTEFLQNVVNVYEESGRNKAECARRLKCPRPNVQHWVEAAERRKITAKVQVQDNSALLQINENLRQENARLGALVKERSRPHFTVRQDTAGRGGKIRVVVIGDAHDSPDIPDKSRFEWIGKYINQTKPDVVVQIGDFATLDSLNTHVPNETFQGKSKPTYMKDMESFNLALGAMQLKDGIERHCTLGNHERRLFLFEDNAPATWGMMQFELQKIFERHKWTFSPYGLITYYGGVGFVHAALNRLGKTFGGKTAEVQIANESVHDLFIGHSHIERVFPVPKIGRVAELKIINTGCALPNGHIESYAKHAMTGWCYGICDSIIQHGRVTDHSFVSMETLEGRYAKRAA